MMESGSVLVNLVWKYGVCIVVCVVRLWLVVSVVALVCWRLCARSWLSGLVVVDVVDDIVERCHGGDGVVRCYSIANECKS